MRLILGMMLIAGLSVQANAQDEKKSHDGSSRKKFNSVILLDSMDRKLDLSNFLIDFHGFIPVPQIITEPALGHFGLLLTPVFIHPNKVQVKGKYIPPDITAGFAGYTANDTWGLGAIRIASLPERKLKYRAGVAYGDINMNFYRSLPSVGEKKFGFNFRATAVFLSMLRELGDGDWYIGLDYSYAHNKVRPTFEFSELPDFVTDDDLESNLSSLGPHVEIDKRDNVFTPNTGFYVVSTYRINASWIGSDYDFQKLNIAAFKYFQFSHKWVSGFRLEGTFLGGDAPFYLKPFIDMRGVPMSRYQGDRVYMFETEQRYDLSLRWSGILIGGLGKAPTDEVSFNDTKLVYTYGTGFRYLIARKFKLRTGIDIAWSNEDFGWYVVFGSAWNNRN